MAMCWYITVAVIRSHILISKSYHFENWIQVWTKIWIKFRCNLLYSFTLLGPAPLFSMCWPMQASHRTHFWSNFVTENISLASCRKIPHRHLNQNDLGPGNWNWQNFVSVYIFLESQTFSILLKGLMTPKAEPFFSRQIARKSITFSPK